MSQRTFWEDRINEVFNALRKARKQAVAKDNEARAAKIAKDFGVDKDLKTLERMEALRKSVADRLEKVCRERGIHTYATDPNGLLDAIAASTADSVLAVLDAECQKKLLSCLHKAVGAAELRTAIAEIEKALAELEKQIGNGDQRDNGKPATGLTEADFFGRLKTMKAARG